MKRRVNQLFVPFLILIALGLSQVQAQKVNFFTNSLAQLENQVKQSRTPYFLYFKVQDCDACSKMQKETFTYAPLANYVANSYMGLQVNGLDFSEGIDIATRYNVKKYPTTMILGPDGQVRERVEGYIDGPMMLTLLQKAVRPSDRDLANRNLNTYSPPSSRGADMRTGENTRDGYDDRFGDRDIANRNPFDDRPNPSYASEPNIVNSNNNNGTTRSDDYNFGVDKRDYLNDYFNNRSDDNLKAKSAGTTRGGSSSSSYVDRGDLNSSFYDDRSRSAYNDATERGDYVYQKPKEKPVTTIQDRYANDSYLDDRNRDPDYVREQRYNNTDDRYAGVRRGGDDEGGSFLDPIEDDRSDQRYRGDDNYRGGNTYVDPSQPVTASDLDNLPDGTILKRGPDGKWYVYNEYRGGSGDPEQATRGGGESMRTSNRGNAAPMLNNTSKTITKSVPGFATYSPKDLTQNTFGLVIGTYISMSDLQGAIQEFMEHNNARLWVYSEKLGTTHFFKLAMGEYQGEQQAVSDALHMGASWEDIEVINLARLR